MGPQRTAATLCEELYRLPDRQPADALAEGRGGVRELGLDRLAALAEVLPALVVDRDHRAGADQAAELDRFGRVHRVAQRAGDREPDAAEVDDRGVDLQPAG